MLFCFNNLMTPSDSPGRGRTWETASDYMPPLTPAVGGGLERPPLTKDPL